MIKKISKELFIGLVSVMIPVFLYSFISYRHSSIFLPPISEILTKLSEIVSSGLFFTEITITLERVLISLFLAILLALIIGIPMGLNKVIRKLLDIPLTLGLTIPLIVYVTITLIVFGINNTSVIIATVLIVTPLLVVPALTVVRSVNNPLLDMAKVFKLSSINIFRFVILPQLIPTIISMLRTGFSYAWKAVLVAEIFGISNGVGYQIILSFYQYSASRLLSWTLSFTIVVLIIEKLLFNTLQNAVAPWIRDLENESN